MRKERRWYAVEGATAYVYDEPCAEQARSVSIVPIADLAYYRSRFILHKVWS